MKQIALILTLLLAAAGASAQEVFIGADFDTRFDNREHSDCMFLPFAWKKMRFAP